jgi:hypothetical protein
MGPYSELKQLTRLHSVDQILAKPTLSKWARRYWQSVRDTIAFDEDRYNARVAQTYTHNRFTRGISHEQY